MAITKNQKKGLFVLGIVLIIIYLIPTTDEFNHSVTGDHDYYFFEFKTRRDFFKISLSMQTRGNIYIMDFFDFNNYYYSNFTQKRIVTEVSGDYITLTYHDLPYPENDPDVLVIVFEKSRGTVKCEETHYLI